MMFDWDYPQMALLGFTGVCLGAMGIQYWWLRRLEVDRLPWKAWLLSLILIVGGWFLVHQSEARELMHVKLNTQGFARLYASELERAGHEELANDVEETNPHYLELIEREKAWLAINPAVNDIYTLRKLPDGRNIFIVDSETDYDHDGVYRGEREARTKVGEVYEPTIRALESAFVGKSEFEFVPMTDRWGTWLSAFVPMFNKAGKVDAVLGVDFEAARFQEAVNVGKIRMVSLMGLVQLVLLGSSVLNARLRAQIAHRLKAEEALRKSEALRRAILDYSPAIIFSKDRDGRYLEVNPEFELAAGLHREEILGKTDAELFANEDAEFRRSTDLKVLAADVPLTFEETCEMADGVHVLNVAKFPLRDAQGRVYATGGIGTDITQRRRSDVEIERMNKELLEVSRRAGMAEVATSVLHNIGNVLNSVNVSCALIADKVRKSRISAVGKLAEMLRQHSSDLPGFLLHDPNGKKLPEFLERLSERLDHERSTVLEEIHSLGQNIEHIKDIVVMQQSYAKVGGVLEKLEVAEVFEEAVRMNQATLAEGGVTLRRAFAEVPPILMDKHRVLQILVNLIRNSVQALSENAEGERYVDLEIEARGRRGISLRIRDNGVGIAPENLVRIFAHGFTTKKSGHGFGLHSGILAAQEMGGSLLVESRGVGGGASFTLELPAEPKGLL